MTGFAQAMCFMVLGCVSVVDMLCRKIPNTFLFLLFACGYIHVCAPDHSILSAFGDMLIVGILLLLFSSYYDIMGGGDIKMCAISAFCFGVQPVLLAISIACIGMYIVALHTHKKSLPMAPFFTFSCVLTTLLYQV